MNGSLSVKYYMQDYKKSLLVFYGILIGLQIISVAPALVNSNINVSSSGLEVASMIFLFVAGLNSFRVPFLFFLVNGVSRKTMYKSAIVSFTIVSAVMAAVDTLSGLVFYRLADYITIFEQIYGPRYGIEAFQYNLQFIFERFIWLFCLYVLAIFIGYFITVLYYRMDIIWKYIVSIGVPAFLFLGIPTINNMTDGKVFVFIAETFLKTMGLWNGHNPYIAMLSFVGGAIIFMILGNLLTRKVIIKKS
ncbi:hypothetical protein IEO70_18330 [Bacillus sp. AGMB 02131]|uniref:Uncharacterized protein n=1 Tax=Peribacillus faecalis TaxID=2772559 RepID=A0A927HD40_9BACI|nr:hypothetical protein [Peribacillus faecalis]MBD3110287.1 hypothetical protein [Peribacillus faecalis]